MDRRNGDRAVSEVVGFILVFGMLVASFTVYQGIVVPEQNRQVEFQHNQAVQGELQELRNAIIGTAATGSGEAVSVTLGATYPSRTLAQNLGVSAGAIRTVETGAGIRVDNVQALDEETSDYVDGDVGPFASASVRYTPVYSFYPEAPVTVYENTLAYNRFDGANLTITDQVLIDDRRITLVAVNGSLSASQRGTVSVSTEPVSPAANRVAVENTPGNRVAITVPTELSASSWEEILEEELVANGGHVEDVTQVSAGVRLELEQGVVYELGTAKVGVGSGATSEGARYVVDVEGDGTSVPEGGTQKLVVEVRDRFNNPVSNVTVSASVPPGDGTLPPGDRVTVSDGRASFTYSAPNQVHNSQSVDVTVSFDDGGDATEVVTFDVEVLNSDGSSPGGPPDRGPGLVRPNSDDVPRGRTSPRQMKRNRT